MDKNFKCAVCGSIVRESEVYHIMDEPVPTCSACHETDMLFPVNLFVECCNCGYYFAVDSPAGGDCSCPSCSCRDTMLTTSLA